MANALPAEMTVIETPKPGGPEALVPGRRPVPTPGPGEVLIRIAAAGVNRADCMQRAGSYPLPPGASDIIGLECSGTVAGTGEGVEGWAVDMPVCARSCPATAIANTPPRRPRSACPCPKAWT